MITPFHRVGLLPSLIVAAAVGIGLAKADCECGYSITTGDSSDVETFTDLLESDFIHVNYVGAAARETKGWAAQAFNMSAGEARGPYGESFAAGNTIGNEIEEHAVWTGDGENGGAAGLQLVVGSEVVNGLVECAEVATTDLHYFHGTFRVGMKITNVPGTCSAFFWYFNDTQEIDMEFLSSEFNRANNSYPVNLVLQTPSSMSAGYDAAGTGTFIRRNLPFDPSAGFHEYRFDFLPGRVLFYADNALLASMNDSAGAVPTSPGHLILSHWSNGNDGWSQGPPARDATTTVAYVKAYYNSSDESRQGAFRSRCDDADLSRSGAAAVCAVPEGNSTFFFMYENNMTTNQTTYGDDDESSASVVRSCMAVLVVALATMAWVRAL
ncbi:glycoside hydrolase family 16 protein [Xylariales sp. AK1849]|nr:glycoside hydrolase family 16 protein [Xylariales sp. AK1849]